MAVEYLPVPQSVHATLPVVVLYLPAAHAVQEPAGPVNPASQGFGSHVNGLVPTFTVPELHVQLVIEVLLVGAELNCGQLVQLALPLVSL